MVKQDGKDVKSFQTAQRIYMGKEDPDARLISKNKLG
jgi:hypothetical protein